MCLVNCSEMLWCQFEFRIFFTATTEERSQSVHHHCVRETSRPPDDSRPTETPPDKTPRLGNLPWEHSKASLVGIGFAVLLVVIITVSLLCIFLCRRRKCRRRQPRGSLYRMNGRDPPMNNNGRAHHQNNNYYDELHLTPMARKGGSMKDYVKSIRQNSADSTS